MIGLEIRIPDGPNSHIQKHSIQQQLNAYSSQAPTEHSPGQMICQATKQASKFKIESYQASSPATSGVNLEINLKKKTGKFTNMQRLNSIASEQPMSQQRN